MVMTMKLQHVDELSGGRKRFRRDPLPEGVLQAVNDRLSAKLQSPELGLIWRILAGTGCRGAEVVGLRVEDVITEHAYPHI
jgi:integrase